MEFLSFTFFSARSLAFLQRIKLLCLQKNRNFFLSILKLLSEFYFFLKLRGNAGKRSSRYLTGDFCDKIIKLYAVLGFLNKNKNPLSNCSNQSYDNASNMSVCYTSLQARISQLTEFAIFLSLCWTQPAVECYY